jgi:hypothetical protein
MTISYTTGQITLTNGSAVVTGVGTAWATALIAGGLIAAEADGNPLPIATVDSNTAITAAIAWKGASGTYNYALTRDTAFLQQLNVNSNTLARLIAELDAGTIFKYDASGDLAGRASYDSRTKGFAYLVIIGVDNPELYVKTSSSPGDWSGPFGYASGPEGPEGPRGAIGVQWRGAWSATSSYSQNDLVSDDDAGGDPAVWISLRLSLNKRPKDNPADWGYFPGAFHQNFDYGLWSEPVSGTIDYGAWV